jgi:hypothetical protein
MEWLLQAKAEVLRRQPTPLSLCLLQMPHALDALDWDRILVSAVTVRRLTSWYMALHRRGIDRSAFMAFVSRGHESDWLLPCTYFFRPACSNAIYFRTLSIAQAVWTGLSRRMTGWLVNNGLKVCGKSRPYYNLRHFPSIYMDRLKIQQIKSVQLYKIRIRHFQITSEKQHIWVMYFGFCRHKFRWLATGSVASMSGRNSGYE